MLQTPRTARRQTQPRLVLRCSNVRWSCFVYNSGWIYGLLMISAPNNGRYPLVNEKEHIPQNSNHPIFLKLKPGLTRRVPCFKCINKVKSYQTSYSGRATVYPAGYHPLFDQDFFWYTLPTMFNTTGIKTLINFTGHDRRNLGIGVYGQTVP